MAKGKSSFTVNPRAQSATPGVIDDVLKIRRLLLKGLPDPRGDTEFQPEGMEQKFTLRIIDAEFRKGALWIELAETPEAFVAGMKGMFMIFSPELGAMGFRSHFVEINEHGRICLESPDRVVRVQKRLDPRYTVPAGYELNVEFKKAVPKPPPSPETEPKEEPKVPSHHLEQWSIHTCRILDISSTGIGFFIPAAEAEAYPKGTKLKQIQLKLRGRVIQAHGEVMTCLPYRAGPPDTMKVGVRFFRITEDDQEFLRSYVIEHLIQYDTFGDI